MPHGVKRRRSSHRPETPSDVAPPTSTPPAGQARKRRKVRVDPGHRLSAPILIESEERASSEDPGCAMRLTGLPDGITLLELQEVLEKFFDSKRFTDCAAGAIINFHIRFMGQGSSAAVLLTLPFSALEETYWNSRRRITIPGHPKPLVEHLRKSPYKTIATLREEQALRIRLAAKIPVSKLIFGVWSQEPDRNTGGGSFSAEYEVEGNTRPRASVGLISIWYDYDRRAILIQRIGRPDEVVQDPSSGENTQLAARPLIVGRVRNIASIRLSTDPPGFFLDMHHPPIFEDDHPDDPLGSLRFRCFDAFHSRFEGKVNTSIFVQLPNYMSYHKWNSNMELIPHIPHMTPPPSTAVRFYSGNIYALVWLHSLRNWYKELPLEVALRCEQAVLSHSIRPEDLLLCQHPINAAVEQSGVTIVALTVQHLIDYMASPKGRDALASVDPEDVAARVEKLHELLKQAGEKAVNEVRYGKRWVNPDVALCHHIYATPTTYIVEPPQHDRSNRILRKYPNHQHHFLRVSFSEEGGHGSRLARSVSAADFPTFVRQFVGDALTQGLRIAGRDFEWLGYSNSALKDRQMLFVTPFTIDGEQGEDLITAERIRSEMGIFSDELRKQPAKFGARLGQAFSATDSSIEIPEDAIKVVDDIKRNNYCFTDGCGELSSELAQEIWSSVKSRHSRNASSPPSAFQARFGGCKGVWMVNPELEGIQLLCRKSQMKYESNDRGFNIAATSERPKKTLLNRPLVKLLEDRGVGVDALLNVQEHAVTSIERAQESFELASRLLRTTGLGTHFRASSLMLNMTQMLDLDFTASPQQHIDFWRSVTMLAITHSLRDLKYKARIPVEGPTLIGVCDSFSILKEGEVYIKVVEKGVAQSALKGTVAITRSPVIHPGDLQIAQAIGEVPESSPLASLTNILVFSAEGERPLSNMLGGGDLDGDLFNVITDPALYPSESATPGSYEAVEPRVLEEPCQIGDIADFVVDYIVGDITGIIATRHLEIADYSDEGSFDRDCLKLAELASQAVDFQKSGVPVNFGLLPRGRSRFRPDFLARPEEDPVKDCYQSTRALGVLFRAVPVQKYARPREDDRGKVDASVLFKALQETTGRFPDLCLIPPEPEQLENDWGETAAAFCDLTEKIALRNSPANDSTLKLREEELFLGTLGSAQRLERDDYNLVHRATTQVIEIVRTLRREIKDLDQEDIEDDDSDDDEPIARYASPEIPVGRVVNQADRRKTLLERIGLLPDYVGRSPTSSGSAPAASIMAFAARAGHSGTSLGGPAAQSKPSEIGGHQTSSSRSPTGTPVPEASSGETSGAPDLKNDRSHTGDDNEDAGPVKDNSAVEDTRPSESAPKVDAELVIIQRAFNACHYALGGLSDDGVVPYGLRLFAYVALDVLLATIRRRTAFVAAPTQQEEEEE
ncbi:RdRP-domain-containing protein [Clavulina sp. PMI_390]|nr:RdRP-domain-containing protein [Clavulina sp. PMI_390]